MSTSSWRRSTAFDENADSLTAFDAGNVPHGSATFGCRSAANDSGPSWWRAPARRTVPQQPHELTHAEAAALADAGTMPLSDYLAQAERRHWIAEQPAEPLRASDVDHFARIGLPEKKLPSAWRSAKQTVSNASQWRKVMSRSVRLLPNISVLGAYAVFVTAFVFILMIVAFAQSAPATVP